MSRWAERRGARWLVLAALLPGLSLGCVATAAAAPAHGSGGASAPSGKKGHKHHHQFQPSGIPPQEGQLTSPDQVSAGIEAQELSESQVDPISGLGIHNPVCDEIGQIRNRQTRLSCEANGTPESNYPASNYGFDIFITTGVTHLVGDITYGFATILNGVWLGLIFVLKLVLGLLGLAFGLNPFADGQTMNHITVALGRLYSGITDPWLSTLIVCGGIWFAYKGLLRRELAAGVAGTLAAIAMLVVGLWVVHQPRQSVGQLASLSDKVALATISAPQSGSLHRPVGTYAEAMSRTWSRLVEVPFAGLDFSDVEWALGPPPPEAVERADERFCEDFGALALLAVLSNMGSEDARKACAAFARKRYGRPRRVIDLYLRSSPGSPAREALWQYFDKDEADAYKSKVAAQGGDGVLTRLSMLALFALGLSGAILLLAWLAIRLFTQAAIAFVLLLIAPFALFFPMLGDSGRRAFKTWGLTLLGAIVAKAIYAAFLSVVLLGISILGQVDGSGGSATGFLMSSAFAWSIFLKRAELIGWMSIGEADRDERGFVGKVAALTLARRMSQTTGGVVKGVGRRGAGWARTRVAEGGEATRETAKGSLQNSARALADHRYSEAKRTVARFEGKAEGSKTAKRPAVKEGKREQDAVAGKEASSGRGRAGRESSEPGVPRERYEQAKALVTRADGNQRKVGERWSERDMERFEKEDRELLKSSRDPADHAHRAGIDRSEFEAMRGPDRERAEEAIEKATKRDRQRLDVADSVPGRVIGRPRQAAEGLRQRHEGSNPQRREQLQRLRRDRRTASHLAGRRNLSRGG